MFYKLLGLVGKGYGEVGKGFSRGDFTKENETGKLQTWQYSEVILLASSPFSNTIWIPTGETTHNGDERYESMKDWPVQILCISTAATLIIEVNGKTLVLAPGESWQRQVTYPQVNKNPAVIITSSITNYGWLDRSSIKTGPLTHPGGMR